LTIFNTI